MEQKTISPIIGFLGYLLAFLVFAVGFWHCHLGLKEMRPFDSDYGSIIIATIILMLMIISYNLALDGRKYALSFYIICGLVFFIFNLNYFYPSYLSRQLVNEEAVQLTDTLETYNNNVKLIKNTEGLVNVTTLYKIKNQILDEIENRGFGPRATDYLKQFNSITQGNLKPDFNRGETINDWKVISNRYEYLLEEEIKAFVTKQITQDGIDDPQKLYTGISKLNAAKENYTEPLKEIIKDQSKIYLDEVKLHPQIGLLQSVVTDIDEATNAINSVAEKDIYPRLKEAKSKRIGSFSHTINSVLNRIGKVDTWGIIFICLFIDLIVPLAIYLLLRNSNMSSFSSLFGDNKNITNKSY